MTEDGVIQFRRCHVCGNVTIKPGRVDECEQCGKPVAPFYYFDDRETPVLSEQAIRPEYYTREINPLWGLTAYWEET